MKKYITTDGKTCREVNPIHIDIFPVLYDIFEKDVQHYPLTKEMPIGEFDGKEVWQYQHPVRKDWNDCNGQDYSKTHHVRQCIQPIEKPLEGEEKKSPIDILNGLTENDLKEISNLAKKYAGNSTGITVKEYFESFGSNPKEIWNSAIDECVKVLENRLAFLKHTPNSVINQSEVTYCIEQINSLRK